MHIFFLQEKAKPKRQKTSRLHPRGAEVVLMLINIFQFQRHLKKQHAILPEGSDLDSQSK